MTTDPLEAAVQAHAEAEGFISPADDAWPAMRAAIRAWLEAQVGCDCECCIHTAQPRSDFSHITGIMKGADDTRDSG